MANRITQDILKNQAFTLSRLTGMMLYVGYENGHANLFEHVGESGRATIDYGNTKKELSEKMSMAIKLITIMQDRQKGEKNGK